MAAAPRYDRLSRRTKVIEHGPSGAGTGPETVYAVDAMGNLQSLTDDTGNTTTWTYDLLGWKATETNSDTTPDSRSFYYNNGGMMTRMVNANGQTLAQFPWVLPHWDREVQSRLSVLSPTLNPGLLDMRRNHAP